jgi:hypothetical protein
MVNQDFEKFNDVQQKHKSVYLGGSKSQKEGTDVLGTNQDHGISAGAEGRDIGAKKNKTE